MCACFSEKSVVLRIKLYSQPQPMPQPNYEFVLQAKFPRNMEKKSQAFGLKVEEKNYKTIFLREQTAWKYSYCKLTIIYIHFFSSSVSRVTDCSIISSRHIYWARIILILYSISNFANESKSVWQLWDRRNFGFEWVSETNLVSGRD